MTSPIDISSVTGGRRWVDSSPGAGWTTGGAEVGLSLMPTGMSDPSTEHQMLGLLREFLPEWAEPA